MASPFDLVSISAVQSWLGQSSDAALLGGLISQVSRAALTYMGRGSILPSLYSETRDGGGRRSLVLRRWPVNSIASLAVDGRLIAAAQTVNGALVQGGYSLEPPDLAPPGRLQALLMLGAGFPRGMRNVCVTYNAGYLIADEAALIPLDVQTVTAAQPYGAWASDCGVAYANNVPLQVAPSNPAKGQYCVSDGVYSFNEGDAGEAIVLSYGYVPADIAEAAMEWISERYAYRSRIGQKSKALGGQETMSFDLSPVPPFVAAALQPYRAVLAPC